LAFLKTQIISLPPALLRQLKKEIITQKKEREAAVASKARGRAHWSRRRTPTGYIWGGVSADPESMQAQSQRSGLVQLVRFVGTCS